ncbi:MAG TPA: hypothetical protein VGL53_14530 [Bryobacteraceae bacterium]
MVGSWKSFNNPPVATVDQWILTQIAFLATAGSAKVTVKDLPPVFDGTHGLQGRARRRIEIEFDEAERVRGRIHSRMVVIDAACHTPAVVSLRYFPDVTGSRRQEWNAIEDRLAASIKTGN